MNNENKEISTNHDVEVNISEEEIVLAPQTELFDEAKKIAQSTKHDNKYSFALEYDPNQEDLLLSMLHMADAVVVAGGEDKYSQKS